MKDRLSGLVDGELEGHDAQAVLEKLNCDEGLRDRWQEYLLIRDALKGRSPLDADITSRVMGSLDDEPAVLVPRPALPPRQGWQRPALSLAATLAGVAVVGWLALGRNNPPQAVATLAQNQPVAVSAEPMRQASRDMQEYLVAHQAQSSTLQLRGGTEHIRTVAIAGMAISK